MIEENKIITLDNNDKYLIITKTTLNNNEFFVGIKIINEKYHNEFKIFTSKTKNSEIYVEEIQDNNLIKLIVDNFILEKTIN